MMDIQVIIDTLHPLERIVLPLIEDTISVDKLAEKAELQEVEVMRALQWMQNKKLVDLDEEIKELVELGENGKKYFEKGLPEKRLGEKISDDEFKDLEELFVEAQIEITEKNISLGILKKHQTIIIIKKGNQLEIKRTPGWKFFLEKLQLQEELLKKNYPIELKELNEKEREAYEILLKRKDLLKQKLIKLKKATLTDLGKKLLEKGIQGNYEDKLTTEMLKTKSWEGKKFRRYDIGINVPQVFGGKKQHYRRFLDDTRTKFLSLGFTEMDGPLVETDFWDMDALYMPQFHSARDIHQAYYIKNPEYGDVNKDILEKIKQAHENGGETGSKGWGYKFDIERTLRHLLRTQGTACSARKLASPDLKIPSKYFAIVRCFRYDVIDATHLPDFNQIEGIIVEEGLNLRHLFGLLQMFAKEFANTTEIKLVPAYFPFTEPSVELFAKHPDLGWIELGGAGIFRPEITTSLGINVPVIAWGLGIGRIAMFKQGIKDIRKLYSHDLKFLRESKVI